MKLFVFALASVLFIAIEATANFKNTCNTANTQMTSISQYLSQIKRIAVKNGHTAISAKCDEASQHLSVARSSWSSISSSYGGSPWQARSSPKSTQCQSRLSSCGSAIDWIKSRPEISKFPDYRTPVSNCKTSHTSCTSTCATVWNWPSPPATKPQPSGYYRRERREESEALCPAKEMACPISVNASGHECIDIKTEITSCGGCITRQEGENCLAIEGADEVGCESGTCRVFSALPGFEMSVTTGRPVPITS